MKVLRGEARVSERWKNGRGRTATVEREPDWRVSVARVTDASPFSSFPGSDRALMPISPTGLVLSINGRRRLLGAGEACRFSGEDAVAAADPAGPVEVVNLMWLRDRCDADLTAVNAGSADEPVTLGADTAVLVAIVTAGRLTVRGGPELNPLDAVRLDPGELIVLQGSGTLALARIRHSRSDRLPGSWREVRAAAR